MQTKRNNVFISKKMSYCLRHNPGKYGLKLDQYGYVNLSDFLQAMNRMQHFQPKLTEMRIREIMHESDKQRFAIKNGKIAAMYGHSLPGLVKHRAAVPPSILYHGTAHCFLKSIMQKGLLPMGRQYVHLSVDLPIAISVGKRRDAHPAVLKINAQQASADGLKFFVGNKEVWLCRRVDSKYLTEIR